MKTCQAELRERLEAEIANLILEYEKDGGDQFHHIKVESFWNDEAGHIVYVEILED